MDRPLWPPGAEIAAQCFDHFSAWESRWSEDLEGIDDFTERATVYSYMLDGIDIDLAKAMAAKERHQR